MAGRRCALGLAIVRRSARGESMNSAAGIGPTALANAPTPANCTSRLLGFTVYRNKVDTIPYRSGTKTWDQLASMFKRRQVRDPKDGPGFSLAALTPGTTRAN